VPHDVNDLTLDPFAVTNATLSAGGLDLIYLSASGVPYGTTVFKLY
jgi:hypothetical protein